MYDIMLPWSIIDYDHYRVKDHRWAEIIWTIYVTTTRHNAAKFVKLCGECGFNPSYSYDMFAQDAWFEPR